MTSPHRRRNPHKRRLSTCRRHPSSESTSDLCASCLRERLHGIQTQSPSTSSASTSDVRTRSSSGNRHCQAGSSDPKLLLVQCVEGEMEAEDSKTMKEFIDLELGGSKSSRSLFGAASVFSNKLRQWTTKQKKNKDERSGHGFLRIEGPKSKEIREAISEVAEYAFGRRSIDADPRFSLDIGRLSASDFDEPRASWDGYLTGKLNQRNTQMGVVDDQPAETRDCNGGSVDLQRQRMSFDRSRSVRRSSSVVSQEVRKSISSKEPIKWNPSPLKDGDAVANGSNGKGLDEKKSPWQWKKVLSFSGFKPRRKEKQFVMEEKGSKTTASESMNGILENVAGKDESHDDEGSVGHGSLVECLQKLRMLDGEGGGDAGDRASKRILGDGTQTLAESLQQLRMMSRVDENKSCNRNDRNVEALQKLRMVGRGPAEPLQKPRKMAVNIPSKEGAPVHEKLTKSSGYFDARKSCEGYTDAGCEKLDTRSNGYIDSRKSCDGFIYQTDRYKTNSVCEKLSHEQSNGYISARKSCDEYIDIVCEKVSARSNGYIGVRKSCDECIQQIDKNTTDSSCAKLNAQGNGYIGSRKSCDGYIDVVCEKLKVQGNGYIDTRRSCDGCIHQIDGYINAVYETLDARSNGYIGVRKSCDSRKGTWEMKSDMERKEKKLHGSVNQSPSKLKPLRSHDRSRIGREHPRFELL